MIEIGFKNLNKLIKAAISGFSYGRDPIIIENENQVIYIADGQVPPPGILGKTRSISNKEELNYTKLLDGFKSHVKEQCYDFNNILLPNLSIIDGKMRLDTGKYSKEFLEKNPSISSYDLKHKMATNIFLDGLRGWYGHDYKKAPILENFLDKFTLTKIIVTKNKNILKLELQKMIINFVFNSELHKITYTISEVNIPYFMISYRKQYPEIFFPNINLSEEKKKYPVCRSITMDTIKKQIRYTSLENKLRKMQDGSKELYSCRNFIGEIMSQLRLSDDGLRYIFIEGVYAEHFVNFLLKSVYNISCDKIPLLNLLFQLEMKRRQIDHYLDMGDINSIIGDFFGDEINKFDDTLDKESLIMFLFISKYVKGTFSQLKSLLDYYKSNIQGSEKQRFGYSRTVVNTTIVNNEVPNIIINTKYLSTALNSLIMNDLVFSGISFSDTYVQELRNYIFDSLGDNRIIDLTSNIFAKLKPPKIKEEDLEEVYIPQALRRTVVTGNTMNRPATRSWRELAQDMIQTGRVSMNDAVEQHINSLRGIPIPEPSSDWTTTRNPDFHVYRPINISDLDVFDPNI